MSKKLNAKDVLVARAIDSIMPKKESKLDMAIANIVEKSVRTDDDKLAYAEKLRKLFPKSDDETIMRAAGIME